MDAHATVIGIKAKANAAQHLEKLSGFSEPLTEKQCEMMLLLLASAYMDGMIDGVQSMSSALLAGNGK